MCCSVLQCTLQHTATRFSLCNLPALQFVGRIQHPSLIQATLNQNPNLCVAVCCSVLQCVAVCCSVLRIQHPSLIQAALNQNPNLSNSPINIAAHNIVSVWQHTAAQRISMFVVQPQVQRKGLTTFVCLHMWLTTFVCLHMWPTTFVCLHMWLTAH